MKLFISLIVGLFTTLSFASDPQKINVVWPFVATSTQALYIKAILEQTNTSQTKYKFTFEPAQGAGGFIATQKAINDSKNGKMTLLAHTSAFFIRPNLYPDKQYFDEFKPVMVVAKSNAILTTRNQSLESLVSKKRISFATAGSGSATHIFAESFARDLKQKHPHLDILMIHYKNAPEAFVSVMGGHTDATFEFIGNALTTALPETRFIGVTGTETINGIPSLASMGYSSVASLSNTFVIFAPSNVPDEVVAEMQQMFLKAEKTELVQDLYKRDHATKEPQFSRPGNLSRWYKQSIRDFEALTKGIVITN